MSPVPKPFPKEIRADVLRVAQNRDPDQTLKPRSDPDDRFLGLSGKAVDRR
jgi:hypothetical protein